MATTTTTTSKFTKAQKFAMIAEIAEVKSNPMLAEFIAHELELLAKKNSADKKPTEKQAANAVIQSAVLEVLADGKARTITELLKETPNLPEDMTNQRMSALVRQLQESGKVSRNEVKRKAFFSII